VHDGVTGTVVNNSRSAKSLAEAMRALLDDVDLRHRYASQSRAIALEEFDWTTLADRLGRGLAPFDRFKAENRSA
jgi:glycosyltransferase involved in cell wall biosynthesis